MPKKPQLDKHRAIDEWHEHAHEEHESQKLEREKRAIAQAKLEAELALYHEKQAEARQAILSGFDPIYGTALSWPEVWQQVATLDPPLTWEEREMLHWEEESQIQDALFPIRW